MKKIFISYTRKDKDMVFPIVEEIERRTKQGCWIDINGIESAEEFVNKITDAIDAAELVIFMHTKKSAKAKYARKEIQYAMNKQKRTVLLLLDNSPLDNYFLFQFGTQDYIDYNKAEEREKLFKNICSWLGKGETTHQPKETNTQAMTGANDDASLASKIQDHFVVSLQKVQFNMVRVEGGRMTIGGTPEQRKTAPGNLPPTHDITLKAFYIGQFPITQNIWEEVMGYNKSLFKEKEDQIKTSDTKDKELDYMNAFSVLSAATIIFHPLPALTLFAAQVGNWLSKKIKKNPPNIDENVMEYEIGHYPVENITHKEAQEFVRRLSKITNIHFSLPTEEEWEYAARGGQKSQHFKFSGSNNADKVAWHKWNAQGSSKPVGLKKPNELNLYDMSGNVCEWTETPALLSSGEVGPGGPRFIVKGGNWKMSAKGCLVSSLLDYNHMKRTGLGLRVVIRGDIG